MKKLILLLGAIVVIVVNVVFIFDGGQREDKMKAFILSNIEALASGETTPGYKKCYTGKDVGSGTTSQGIIAIYCGDCQAARIWPTGDGECRLD